MYSGVILAYGAQTERALPIEKTSSGKIHSARELVNWYNGEVDSIDKFNWDLQNLKRLSVIGNGNVGVDVA